jgi:Mn-dependent DtxR family transcriptional regulator
MVAKITERQGQYLSFISLYTKVNGRSPAESDIQQYFGVSPPTVHQMVVKLESLELISRKPGVARSIQILVSPDDIPELK